MTRRLSSLQVVVVAVAGCGPMLPEKLPLMFILECQRERLQDATADRLADYERAAASSWTCGSWRRTVARR